MLWNRVQGVAGVVSSRSDFVDLGAGDPWPVLGRVSCRSSCRLGSADHDINESRKRQTHVDTGHESKTETQWFRLSSARPAPTLSVSQEALEDHPVEKIQSDLDRLQIPEMLLADPEQELLYTTSGEVKKYDP